MIGQRSGSKCHVGMTGGCFFFVRVNERMMILITNKINIIKGIIVDMFYIKN